MIAIIALLSIEISMNVVNSPQTTNKTVVKLDLLEHGVYK